MLNLNLMAYVLKCNFGKRKASPVQLPLGPWGSTRTNRRENRPAAREPTTPPSAVLVQQTLSHLLYVRISSISRHDTLLSYQWWCSRWREKKPSPSTARSPGPRASGRRCAIDFLLLPRPPLWIWVILLVFLQIFWGSCFLVVRRRLVSVWMTIDSTSICLFLDFSYYFFYCVLLYVAKWRTFIILYARLLVIRPKLVSLVFGFRSSTSCPI